MQHRSIGRLSVRLKMAPHAARVIFWIRAASTLTVLLVFTSPIPGQCQSQPAAKITVLAYNYATVSHANLVSAEREASRILAIAGARVEWIDCHVPLPEADTEVLCRRGWTAQTPGVRLIEGSNKHEIAEFASTAIPVLVTVYYEHVARRAYREHADAGLPIFLGCIMAHELGHILLAEPVHSATGIMQPEWGHPQFRQAMTGNLLFTRQQAARIQAQAHVLASLRPTADPSLPPSNP